MHFTLFAHAVSFLGISASSDGFGILGPVSHLSICWASLEGRLHFYLWITRHPCNHSWGNRAAEPACSDLRSWTVQASQSTVPGEHFVTESSNPFGGWARRAGVSGMRCQTSAGLKRASPPFPGGRGWTLGPRPGSGRADKQSLQSTDRMRS